MSSLPQKVLFVVGKGRSGSTLLDNLLGQVPGVLSTGELRYLWEWGLVGGHQCGCGSRVRDCEVWRPVIDRVVEIVPEAADPRWAARVTDAVLRWPVVPGVLAAARGGPQWVTLRDFVRLYGALYRTLGEMTGNSLVVDSSKWPAHPGALGLIPGMAPAIVHLVRDPRGVATSYAAGKATGGGQPEMPRFGAVHSAVSWDIRNLTAELLRRVRPGVPSTRIRYEDLVDDPTRVLAQTLVTAGHHSELSFIEGRVARLQATHTVGGNPGRFRIGPIELRPDDRWRRQLPARPRRTVEGLTAPFRRRYGYGPEGR